MQNKIDFIIENKNKINRKKEYKASTKSGCSNLFKVIGCGKSAFKILWFGEIPGSSRPGWNDAFWNYKFLDDVSQDIINQVYKDILGGQSTL